MDLDRERGWERDIDSNINNYRDSYRVVDCGWAMFMLMYMLKFMLLFFKFTFMFVFVLCLLSLPSIINYLN